MEGNSSEEQVGDDVNTNSSSGVNDFQMISSSSLTCLSVIGDESSDCAQRE